MARYIQQMRRLWENYNRHCEDSTQTVCPIHRDSDKPIDLNEEGYKKEYYGSKLKRWDTYYHNICVAVSSKSPCMSRQIGAILVREKIVIATGFNGPPRNYPHCMTEDNICPRHAKGYKSGEGLLECPATHAEANCIASAARIGAPVEGSILYMNCIIPCKDCMSLLINAGVKGIVIDEVKAYHEMAVRMATAANVTIRRFVL